MTFIAYIDTVARCPYDGCGYVYTPSDMACVTPAHRIDIVDCPGCGRKVSIKIETYKTKTLEGGR